MPIINAGGLPNNVGQGIPNLSMPMFNQAPQTNASDLQTSPQQVYSLLAQGQPQSLANTLGPLLSQIFGTQANLLQPLFQQQTNANVADAQTDAMTRGLTGSTIEASNMTAARTQGDQAYDSYLSNQLNGLYENYANALGTDISNQTNYFSNLAGAVGQQYGNQQSENMFTQQLNELLSQAKLTSNASEMSGLFSGLGSFGGGLLNYAASA
jgi:hypothetical protein